MEKRLKSTFQQTISEREMLREYVKTGCEFPAQVHSDRNGDLQHICWKFSQGVAFDGAYVRVANYSGNNVTKPKVSDDTLLGTFNVGRNPLGVAFDGANIWVANAVANGTVRRCRAAKTCIVQRVEGNKDPSSRSSG